MINDKKNYYIHFSDDFKVLILVIIIFTVCLYISKLKILTATRVWRTCKQDNGMVWNVYRFPTFFYEPRSHKLHSQNLVGGKRKRATGRIMMTR